MKETPRLSFKTLVVMLLSMAIFAAATGKYIASQYENFERQHKERFDADAGQITLNITRAFSSLYTLNGFVLSNRLDLDFDEKFEVFAENSREDMAIASHILIAPKGVAEYVYPKSEKFRISGRNLIHDSRNALLDETQQREIQDKIQNGLIYEKAVAVGPVHFPGNAGYGIILQKSIVDNYEFWGLVNIFVPMENLLLNTQIETGDSNIEYAIRDETGTLILGEEDAFSRPAFVSRIPFPEGHWEIAGRIDSRRAFYTSIASFLLLNLALLLMAVSSTRFFLARNWQLQALVEKRTRELKDSQTLFESFMDHISLPVTIRDESGGILYCNRHIHEETDRLLASRFLRSPSPSDPSLRDTRKTLQQEESFTRGQETLHFINHQFLIEQADANLIGSIRMDVTEMKNREAENRRIYFSTISSLAKTIEAKDPYTRGHCERVGSYALKMGRELGLSEEELQTLQYASTLHDIGKIGVDKAILNKKGALEAAEYDLIKRHPVIGYNIVKEIDFLQRASRVILQHHERVDGTGYPYGLKGPDIDLLARIVFVADAFDAMTSERVYRLKPFTGSQALDILKQNAGTQFDADLVDCFASGF